MVFHPSSIESEARLIKTSLPFVMRKKSLETVERNNVSDTQILKFPQLSKLDFHKLVIIELKNSNIFRISDAPFVNAVRLDLSGNLLSDLPKNFKCLNKLKLLNLSHNHFQRLPICFSDGLVMLKHLDLSKNKIKDFSVRGRGLELLEVLNLESNDLECFPEWLLSNRCASLLELNISRNPCLKNIIGTCFYEKFHLLRVMKRSIARTLKKLSLSNCLLTTKNSLILMVFDNLEELCINNDIGSQVASRNYLVDAPLSAMEKMKKLSVLRLSNVYLTCLTDRISLFTNLRVLDLSMNNLTWLPNKFSDLKTLEVCDLSNNNIYDLPEDIGRLKNLSVLLLPSNKVTKLPASFEDLRNLRILDLYSNDLTQSPEVLSKFNLDGLDLENNYFDSKHLKLQNGEYNELRKAYREKFLLNRIDGFLERQNDYSQLSSESRSSSYSCSNESLEGRLCPPVGCNVVNSVENWDSDPDDDSDDSFDDRFDAGVQLRMVPSFVWRKKYICRGEVSEKPLQQLMFRNMRCFRYHGPLVIRADIPETRTDCYMANDWIQDDVAKYLPLVIHPSVILFDYARHPSVEGQFDDAE